MARRERRAEAMTPAELDLAVQRFRDDGGKVIALDWAGKVVGLTECAQPPVADELRAIRREAGDLLARLNALAPRVREARHA